MTETTKSIKSEFSRRQYDESCGSAYLNKQGLSPAAFDNLCLYFKEKQFLLAFVVRGVQYMVPKQQWAHFPTGFEYENCCNSASIADKDFMYVHYQIADSDTEADLEKFIQYLKTEAFEGLNKYLWLNGEIQAL